MEDKNAELLDEIRQVLEQYRKEVPSARRAWPESIKRRVNELVSRGMKVTEISRGTKIPYYTLIDWTRESRAARPAFAPVRVVAALPAPIKKKGGTVTVANRGVGRPKGQCVTVTITTKWGHRIRIRRTRLVEVARLLALIEGGR